MRYLNGGFSTTTVSQKGSKEFTPYLSFSWLGLLSDYDKSLELLNEILLNTDLTKTDEILNQVKSQKSNLKYMIDNNPISVQIGRTLSTIDDENNYNQYMSGLEYYDFLNKVEQMLTTKPDTVTSELKAVADAVLTKTNMITMFEGSQNGIKTYEQKIGSVVNQLGESKVNRQDYSVLPKPSDREGIIANGTVQYNMMAAGYDKMNTTFSGKLIPMGVLIYDNYLTPKIRFENGAYDNIIEFTQKGFYMVSYRDPNIKETYEIYKGLPAYLKNISMTQEDLNRYILKVFSEYTTPTGELSGAESQLMEYLGGLSTQDKLKMIKEIKSATIDDVKNLGTSMDSFIKNASVSTVGSAEKINANKDLFKSIITLGGEQQQKTVTRTELINMLFPGVPNVQEIAVQQGFIKGDGKGNYFMDKKISKQELATIISRILKNAPLQKVSKGAKINDINSVNSWAKDGVTLMVETGIMKPDDGGKFNPQEEVSATYLQELFTLINQKASGK
jgi:Zn-dependent M16 (insulinase) family peptidase